MLTYAWVVLDRAPAAAAAGAPLQLNGTSAATLAAAAAAGGSSNPAAAAAAELWVDKYLPRSVSDLVVHKKKVAEVQDWLTFYNEHRAKHHTRALLITGICLHMNHAWPQSLQLLPALAPSIMYHASLVALGMPAWRLEGGLACSHKGPHLQLAARGALSAKAYMLTLWHVCCIL